MEPGSYLPLEQYVGDRSTYLTELSDIDLPTVLCGKKIRRTSVWLLEFEKCVRDIAVAVDTIEVTLAKETRAKKGENGYNLMASTMNRMMCRAENEMLILAVGIFKTAGRHIGAFCFDDFLVYKSTEAEDAKVRKLLKWLSTTASNAP